MTAASGIQRTEILGMPGLFLSGMSEGNTEMDVKITDAYFEDLKLRRHRREMRARAKQGKQTSQASAKRQQPRENKSQRKMA